MKHNHKKIFTLIIIFLFILWISASTYIYLSEFDLEDIFKENLFTLEIKIIIVLLLYIFRNYLLIPSTVAILFCGYFLQNFWLTLGLSIIGVWIGILQTYFVWYVFWEDLKENKKFQLISQYNDKIKQNGFKVIFFWSLFPIIPVDILYYSAWFVKYNLTKTFIAWIFWELPLIILYVYLWKEAYKYNDYLFYIVIWIIIILGVYYWIKKLFWKK